MVENFGLFFIFLAGTIFLDLIFRFGLSKYLKAKTKNIAFYSDFSHKLTPPISQIIYITGVYFAISTLDLMEATQASFTSVYKILIFLMASWLIFRVIACFKVFLSDYMIKNGNESAVYFVPLVIRALNIVFSVVLGVLLLQKLGYNITSLLAGLGITGLALGFAAKETLSDVLASFTVILDNIFKIGDMVVLDASVGGEHIQGTVEDISLFSTKIRALDNSLVVISNHRILEMNIKNLSRRSKMRIKEYVSITYDSSIQKVQRAIEICREIAKNHPQIEDDYKIYLSEFSDSALQIFFNAYALTQDFAEYLEIKEEIFMQIKKVFDEEKIEFAFPSQTLYIKK